MHRTAKPLMLYSMKRPAGFTLIELLITITIMVILMTLAVISLRGNQASARDEERKTDANVIAQQLEAYYQSGSDPITTYKRGQYPPTDLVNSEANVKLALRDLDPKALRSPDVADASPMSFTVATTALDQTPDVNTYIYQPLTSANAICQTISQECRKFNLFYKMETTGTVQKITSKNQ